MRTPGKNATPRQIADSLSESAGWAVDQAVASGAVYPGHGISEATLRALARRGILDNAEGTTRFERNAATLDVEKVRREIDRERTAAADARASTPREGAHLGCRGCGTCDRQPTSGQGGDRG